MLPCFIKLNNSATTSKYEETDRSAIAFAINVAKISLFLSIADAESSKESCADGVELATDSVSASTDDLDLLLPPLPVRGVDTASFAAFNSLSFLSLRFSFLLDFFDGFGF